MPHGYAVAIISCPTRHFPSWRIDRTKIDDDLTRMMSYCWNCQFQVRAQRSDAINGILLLSDTVQPNPHTILNTYTQRPSPSPPLIGKQ